MGLRGFSLGLNHVITARKLVSSVVSCWQNRPVVRWLSVGGRGGMVAPVFGFVRFWSNFWGAPQD